MALISVWSRRNGGTLRRFPSRKAYITDLIIGGWRIVPALSHLPQLRPELRPAAATPRAEVRASYRLGGPPKLRELAAQLKKDLGITAHVVAADRARPEAPGSVLTTLTDRGIAIEALVNNAGFGLSGEFANSARVTFAAARSR